MKTFTCYNITDVETPELKNKRLVGATLALRNVLISPGGSAEVPDDEMSRRDIKCYVDLGAIAVDVLPAEYVLAKGREFKESQPVVKARPPARTKKGR